MHRTIHFIVILVAISLINCNSDSVSQPKEDNKLWTEKDRKFILTELDRTTEALRQEIDTLSVTQWNFHETPDRWSIAEIVEHLEIQNQLHYREISAVANAPQYLKYRKITHGQDQYFSNYASDTSKGQARWFLEPLGRFCTKEAGTNAFYRARGKLKEWVEQTGVDLRKQFTFRSQGGKKSIEELKIGEVRDLHQLLLTGVAHTDRHIQQIKMIKLHEKYPR